MYNNDTLTVTLTGHLTKDVEIKTFNGSKGPFSVGYLDVASNRRYKKGEGYATKTVFNKVKISLPAKYDGYVKILKKGVAINLTGYIDTEEWEKDGKKNFRNVIVPFRGALGISGTSTEERAKTASAPAAAPAAAGTTEPEIPYEFEDEQPAL